MKAQEIRIAEPCTVDWTAMTPAEGGRFCGDCKKVVRNLSSMTEREAKKMLRSENDGQLCVRFLYDTKGKIWFGPDAPKADPLLPATMLSRAKRIAAMASVALATQACDAVSGMADDTTEPEELHRMMGGAPAYPDQPPPPAETDGGSTADASAADGSTTDGGTEIY